MTFEEWYAKTYPWREGRGGLEARAAWNAALEAAIAECTVTVSRPHAEKPDAVGARNCYEIRDALIELRERAKEG